MSEVTGRALETRFSSSDISNLVPIAVAACLSCFAIVCLLVRIAFVSLRCLLGRVNRATQSREATFFRTQLGAYTVCLILGTSLSSLSGLLELRWLVLREIMEGPLCTLQAMLAITGDFLTAYFTSVIAIHTFGSLVMKNRTPKWLTVVVVVFGWTFALLFAFLPFHVHKEGLGPVYGNALYMCSIVGNYPLHNFLMHLLPVFITAVISAVLYSIIFLVIRGSLVIRGGLRFEMDPRHRWQQRDSGRFEDYRQFLASIARSMLWFPTAYLTFALPHSFTLLLAISGFQVTWSVKAFATSFMLLLGAVDVLLVLNILRVLSPVIISSGDFSEKPQRGMDWESFQSPERGESRLSNLSQPVQQVGAPLPPAYSSNASSMEGSMGGLPAFAPPQTRSLTHNKLPTSFGSNSSLGLLLPEATFQRPLTSNTLASEFSLLRTPPGPSNIRTSAFEPPFAAYAPRINVHVARTSPLISGFITPIDELNDQISVPVPVAQTHGRRNDSVDSGHSTNLAPPPRRNRSPVEYLPLSPEVDAPVPWAPLTPAAGDAPASFRKGKTQSKSHESLYSLYLHRSPSAVDGERRFEPVPVRPQPQRTSARGSALGTADGWRRMPSLTALGVKRSTSGLARAVGVVAAKPALQKGYDYI